MSTKNVIKIILDIIMAVLFIALLLPNRTGFIFHEVMGIAILLLFAIHLLLNKKWISSVSKKFFSSQTKGKTTGMYLLDMGLLICAIIIAVTGLMISTYILPQDNSSQSIVLIHKLSAYIMVGLIVVHLVLHSKYMVTSIKKIGTNIKTIPVRNGISGACAAVLVCGILYHYISLNINEATYESSALDSTSPPSILSEDETTITTPKDEDEESSTFSEPQEGEAISLSEFLSKFTCDACGRHCLLSSPRCMKSTPAVEEATAEYQTLYGEQ